MAGKGGQVTGLGASETIKGVEKSEPPASPMCLMHYKEGTVFLLLSLSYIELLCAFMSVLPTILHGTEEERDLIFGFFAAQSC